MGVLLILVTGVACAIYSGNLASSKGHDSAPWAIGGLLLGPLALLAAIGLPDLKLRKYVRLLAENQGVIQPDASIQKGKEPEDLDAQRRRILGIKP